MEGSLIELLHLFEEGGLWNPNLNKNNVHFKHIRNYENDFPKILD